VSIFKRFLPPDPVPLTVKWRRSADDVAETLASLAAQGAFVAADPNSVSLFRLGGSVRGRAVSLRATPYKERGIRPRGLELAVEGEITPTDGGSQIDGRARATLPIWMVLLVLGFIAFAAVDGGVVGLIVSSLVLGVVAAVAIPRYQRAELLRVDELAAALARV
jgi:hypothetical protein